MSRLNILQQHSELIVDYSHVCLDKSLRIEILCPQFSMFCIVPVHFKWGVVCLFMPSTICQDKVVNTKQRNYTFICV